MSIKLIAATSLNGIIGKNNSIPWQGRYSEDMQFFRKMTANSTVIMGRKTYESIGRVLPKRTNIVVTSGNVEIQGALITKSLQSAIEIASNIKINESDTITPPIWIMGGAQIYRESLILKELSEIYLTIIPEEVKIEKADEIIYFPWIDPTIFEIRDIFNIADNLKVVKYTKI